MLYQFQTGEHVFSITNTHNTNDDIFGNATGSWRTARSRPLARSLSCPSRGCWINLAVLLLPRKCCRDWECHCLVLTSCSPTGDSSLSPLVWTPLFRWSEGTGWTGEQLARCSEVRENCPQPPASDIPLGNQVESVGEAASSTSTWLKNNLSLSLKFSNCLLIIQAKRGPTWRGESSARDEVELKPHHSILWRSFRKASNESVDQGRVVVVGLHQLFAVDLLRLLPADHIDHDTSLPQLDVVWDSMVTSSLDVPCNKILRPALDVFEVCSWQHRWLRSQGQFGWPGPSSPAARARLAQTHRVFSCDLTRGIVSGKTYSKKGLFKLKERNDWKSLSIIKPARANKYHKYWYWFWYLKCIPKFHLKATVANSLRINGSTIWS